MSNTRSKIQRKAPWYIEITLLLLLSVFVSFLYYDTLNGPFAFDDFRNISKNDALHIPDLSFKSLYSAGFDSYAYRRPIANISFALNYYVHTNNPLGYRVVNIGIHLLVGVLLYFFVNLTLNLAIFKGKYPLAQQIALFTALIWLLHPVATQSVAYIVQRMTSLATMFYLLSLVLYIQARLMQGVSRWLCFFGAILAGALAVGSKEIAATLICMIFLYEWFFFQDLSKAWLKRFIPILVVIFVGFAWLLWLQKPWNSYTHRPFDLLERLLTEMRVLMQYISLWFLPIPSRLNLDHDFIISKSLFNPITTLYSLMSLLSILSIIILSARKHRLLAFCLLWFLGNLVIESTIMPLEIIFEHRTYLPFIGLALLTVLLLYQYVERYYIALIILSVICALLSWGTYQRNKVWVDAQSLWSDVVLKSPNKSRGHNNLGMSYLAKDEYQAALSEFDISIRLNKRNFRVYRNRAYVRTILEDYEGALADYNNSIDYFREDQAKAYYNRGNLRTRLKDYKGALADYNKAIKQDVKSTQSYNNRATVKLHLRDYAAAILDYSEAIKLSKASVSSYIGRGDAKLMLGQKTEAVDDYNQALKLSPKSANTYYKRGQAYLQLRNQQRYCEDFKRAKQLGSKVATNMLTFFCR